MRSLGELTEAVGSAKPRFERPQGHPFANKLIALKQESAQIVAKCKRRQAKILSYNLDSGSQTEFKEPSLLKVAKVDTQQLPRISVGKFKNDVTIDDLSKSPDDFLKRQSSWESRSP